MTERIRDSLHVALADRYRIERDAGDEMPGNVLDGLAA